VSFEIKDRAASGRIGILDTPHGKVHTPTLLPVVNPNLRLIPPQEMKSLFGAQMIITNSYILRQHEHLREAALRDGVHKVVGWDGPIMTDSGTFQSYMYGQVHVQPDEILDFQKRIGVDVGTILDVFTTPDRTHEEAALDLEETMVRAKRAAANKDGMLLAGTVQGGIYADLREKAAQGIAALDVDITPIGGVVPLMEQSRYATLTRVIMAAKKHLPAGRPVHLFGAGHPLVFPLAAALGCDLFDSASYAKFAKDGRMIFAGGTRSLSELEELGCPCPACDQWQHAKELRDAEPSVRERALAEHNLHVSFAEIRRIRQAIRDGALWELVEERAAQNPFLFDALRALQDPALLSQLERCEPTSSARALTYRGTHTMHRPAVARLHERLLHRYRIRGDRCVVLPPRLTPYTDAYVAYLEEFMDQKASYVVDSSLGMVPLELDLTWPVAQSVFPETLDHDSMRVRQAFNDAFLARFEGCEVMPFDATEYHAKATGPSEASLDLFDARRVQAIADHQLGAPAGDALLAGALTFVRSPNNRRVRNVLADGRHVASLRAEDGLFSLRWAGAQRIHDRLAAPGMRIQVDTDAGPFVREGKNVIAKTVRDMDPALRPGDDAIVVDQQDALVGIAKVLLAPHEFKSVPRGIAARTTEGHPPGDFGRSR
jgi:7-cyano-7-deazaguanine tRNA-ribosyltransferase